MVQTIGKKQFYQAPYMSCLNISPGARGGAKAINRQPLLVAQLADSHLGMSQDWSPELVAKRAHPLLARNCSSTTSTRIYPCWSSKPEGEWGTRLQPAQKPRCQAATLTSWLVGCSLFLKLLHLPKGNCRNWGSEKQKQKYKWCFG